MTFQFNKIISQLKRIVYQLDIKLVLNILTLLLIILNDSNLASCELDLNVIQKLVFLKNILESSLYKRHNIYSLPTLKNKYHIVYTPNDFPHFKDNQFITQSFTHYCFDKTYCSKILETDLMGENNVQYISNVLYKFDTSIAHLLKVDYSKLKGLLDLEPLIIQHKMNILNGNIPFRDLNIPELFKEFKIKNEIH